VEQRAAHLGIQSQFSPISRCPLADAAGRPRTPCSRRVADIGGVLAELVVEDS
jgi:hypothetical protein